MAAPGEFARTENAYNLTSFTRFISSPLIDPKV